MILVLSEVMVVVGLILVLLEKASLSGVSLWVAWIARTVTILALRAFLKGQAFLVPQDSLRLFISEAV